MRAGSLRIRLTVWSAAVAITVAIAVAVTFYAGVRGTLIESLDESLETRAQSIAAIVRTAGGRGVTSAVPALRPFAGEESERGFDVRSAADLSLIVKSGAGTRSPFSDADLESLRPRPSGHVRQRRRLVATSGDGGEGSVRALAQVFPGAAPAAAADGAPEIVVIVYEDLGEILADLDEMLGRLAAVTAIGAGLAILGAWVLARRIAGPIEAIADAAARVEAGSPGNRVPETGAGDEIDRMAGVINRTLARIEDAYARQVQFTADASHELRTPVAIVLSQCDVALRRPRTSDEYRAAFEASRTAALRMSDLIEGLLLLARSESGAGALRLGRLDAGDLARAAAAECADAAAAAQRTIRVDAEGIDLTLDGDASLLAVLLRNLVTNSVVHAGRPGEIVVGVRRRPSEIDVFVQDDGVGIAPEHLPHVFDRFRRGDVSRSRASGGSGLGLAIVRRIAELHGGSVGAQSEPDRGCTVTVTLPRAGPFPARE